MAGQGLADDRRFRGEAVRVRRGRFNPNSEAARV
jgi:hypothetical protein